MESEIPTCDNRKQISDALGAISAPSGSAVDDLIAARKLSTRAAKGRPAPVGPLVWSGAASNRCESRKTQRNYYDEEEH